MKVLESLNKKLRLSLIKFYLTDDEKYDIIAGSFAYASLRKRPEFSIIPYSSNFVKQNFIKFLLNFNPKMLNFY